MSSIYVVFFSRNVKRTHHTDRSILHFKVYFLWKETTRNPSNVSAAINLFSGVCVCVCVCVCYWYNFLRWMLFILSDNWKTLFLKIYRYSEGSPNRHVAAFFERRALKEVRILRRLVFSRFFDIRGNLEMLAQCSCQSSKIKFMLVKFP